MWISPRQVAWVVAGVFVGLVAAVIVLNILWFLAVPVAVAIGGVAAWCIIKRRRPGRER